MAETQSAPEPTVIVIAPKLKVVEQAALVFKDKRSEPLLEAADTNEAVAKAQSLACVLIYSISVEAEIAPCLQLCLALSLEKGGGSRRMLVVSKLDNAKLRNALLNKGVSEFLSDSSSTQAIVFKATLLLRQVQRATEQPAQKRSRAQMMKEPSSQVTDQILSDDIWLIKSASPRKVGIKWVIESFGPDPDSGTWEALETREQRAEQWVWRPFGDDGQRMTSQPGQTDWVFLGNRPTFDSNSQKWKFVGKDPELYGLRGTEKIGSRIKLDNGIVLTKDSPEAEARIQRTKVIGDKVRKERERATVEKEKTERGNEVIRGAQADDKNGTFVAKGQTAATAGMVIQEGVKAKTHMAIEDKAAVGSHLVPSPGFEPAKGNWETVENEGFAFVTPEIKSSSPEELEQKAAKTNVDGAAGATLATATPPAGSNRGFASVDSKRNNLTDKPADQAATNAAGVNSKQQAPKSPLQHFFFISEMISSGQIEEAVLEHIVNSTRKILAIDDLLIIEPVTGGGKRNATVVTATQPQFHKGQMLDLEHMTYKDALTDLEPRTFDFASEKCIATFPIVSPTPPQTSYGCLILFFAKSERVKIGKQKVYLNGVTKQLLRLFSSSQLRAAG